MKITQKPRGGKRLELDFFAQHRKHPPRASQCPEIAQFCWWGVTASLYRLFTTRKRTHAAM